MRDSKKPITKRWSAPRAIDARLNEFRIREYLANRGLANYQPTRRAARWLHNSSRATGIRLLTQLFYFLFIFYQLFFFNPQSYPSSSLSHSHSSSPTSSSSSCYLFFFLLPPGTPACFNDPLRDLFLATAELSNCLDKDFQKLSNEYIYFSGLSFY